MVPVLSRPGHVYSLCINTVLDVQLCVLNIVILLRCANNVIGSALVKQMFTHFF